MVVFFLDKDLSPTQISELEKAIALSPLVGRVQFISQEQALRKFENNFPELRSILKTIETNPFPPSFEVLLKEKAAASPEIFRFIEEMRNTAGISDVQFNKDWVEKMQSLSRLAKAIGLFLGGILVLASLFIISNVIKLNVLARKNQIEILRLVGATNTFIRIPFLLEGSVLGILGSLLSLLLLFILIKLFPVYLGTSLGALQELIGLRYLSFSQSINLVIAGALIGLLGSLSSLSRFLKI
jgi:cell division transport system permease protein